MPVCTLMMKQRMLEKVKPNRKIYLNNMTKDQRRIATVTKSICLLSQVITIIVLLCLLRGSHYELMRFDSQIPLPNMLLEKQETMNSP